MTDCAVAYLVFNRPRHTRKTFAAIRALKPKQLFVIADGPRDNVPEDVTRCQEVRDIVEEIDWPCDVHRNYVEQNLGLRRRISSGIDWVFEKTDRAIILEDDCLPHPDFFKFCCAMLDRYEDDDRVSVVTGNNFQDGRWRGESSYYFSSYNHCWGWATWRRAWKHNCVDMHFWPEWRETENWRQKLPDPVERKYWQDLFDAVWQGHIDSWAYPWTASVWHQGGMTVTPNVNLVTNIGFGPDASHTVADKDLKGIVARSLGEIKHPADIIIDKEADVYVFENTFCDKDNKLVTWLKRFTQKIASIIKPASTGD